MMLFSLPDKAVWFQEEGKEVIENWLSIYKKGMKDFKTSTHQSYNKVTVLLSKAT
jgi:hypothetical protein